jgi:hypothetical protein
MPIDPSLQTPENYMTPAQLQSQRDYAKYLLENQQKNIRSPWQGVANVVQALVGGTLQHSADVGEMKARQQAAQLLGQKFDQNDLGGVIGAASNPYSNPEAVKLAAALLTPQSVDTGLGTVRTDRFGRPIEGSYIPKIVQGKVSAGGAEASAFYQGSPSGGVNVVQPGSAPTLPPPGARSVQSSPSAWGDKEAEDAGLYPPAKPRSVRDSVLDAKSEVDAAAGPATSTPPVAPTGRRKTTRESVQEAFNNIQSQQGDTPATFNERFDPLADIARKGIAIGAAKKRADTMAEEGAKATMAPIAEAAKEVKTAPQMLNSLNIIEDIARTHGDKITTGSMAEPVLKLKQAVNGVAGRDVLGDTAPAEMIKKMNAHLASAAIPAFTARGTQFDLKTFMDNSPGLNNSIKGTLFLTSVMKQVARQNLELGKLASDPANYASWSDVQQKYYDAHPLINPLTGTALGVSSDTKQQKNTKTNQGFTIINGYKIEQVP